MNKKLIIILLLALLVPPGAVGAKPRGDRGKSLASQSPRIGACDKPQGSCRVSRPAAKTCRDRQVLHQTEAAEHDGVTGSLSRLGGPRDQVVTV